MKLNQKGAVDMMLAITVVIVLAVGGFVIYKVMNADVDSELRNTTQSSTNNSGADTSGQDAADTQGDSNSDSNDLNSWTLFEDPQGGFTMKLPNGWSVVAFKDYSGFYSTKLQDDVNSRATIQLNETGGRGGPFLFSAAFIEDGDMLDPNLVEDTAWTNKYNISAKRYTMTVEADGPDGSAGDKVVEYVFSNQPNDFRFKYLMMTDTEDLTDVVEAALSTLAIN